MRFRKETRAEGRREPVPVDLRNRRSSARLATGTAFEMLAARNRADFGPHGYLPGDPQIVVVPSTNADTFSLDTTSPMLSGSHRLTAKLTAMSCDSRPRSPTSNDSSPGATRGESTSRDIVRQRRAKLRNRRSGVRFPPGAHHLSKHSAGIFAGMGKDRWKPRLQGETGCMRPRG